MRCNCFISNLWTDEQIIGLNVPQAELQCLEIIFFLNIFSSDMSDLFEVNVGVGVQDSEDN